MRNSLTQTNSQRSTQWDIRLIGVAIGAWLAALWAVGTDASQAWLGAGFAGLISFTCWCLAARSQHSGLMLFNAATVLGAAISLICCGGQLWVRDSEPLPQLADRQSAAIIQATISDDPRKLPAGPIGNVTYLIKARIDRLKVADKSWALQVRGLIFASKPGWSHLLPGQRIELHGRLAPPRGGDLTAMVISAMSAPRSIASPPWYQHIAGGAREKLRHAAAVVPGDAGALIPALSVGDISLLSPRMVEEFHAVGLTHLSAVSGANLAIVTGLVLFLARAARAGPRLSVLFAFGAMIGFVIMARPSPSVLRAAVMASIILLALASARRRAALPALATAVFGLVLWDPELARSPGFALSVLATGALITLAPMWRDWLRRHKVPPGVAEALAVPAAAHVVCMPVIAAMSGSISLVAIPANILAEPVVAPITIAGIGAAVVGSISFPIAQACVWLAGWPARWLVIVAKYGAAFPGGQFGWQPGVFGGLLLVALIIVCALAIRYQLTRLVLLAVLIAIAAVVIPLRIIFPAWPPTNWRLVACDVGQGDALLLRTSRNAAVVVDTGPNPAAINSCLHRFAINDVPLLILTHFDYDHVGGVSGVVSGRRIGAVAVSSLSAPASGVRLVQQATSHIGITSFTPQPGWRYQIAGLRLMLLNLDKPAIDSNNASLVIRAEFAGISVLLTGDIGAETQREFVASGQVLHCDVLKVPHHGSADADATFFTAAAPKVALISVGAANSYGHPTSRVLKYLRHNRVRVYRTDQDGDVVLIRQRKHWGVMTATNS